MVVLDSMNAHFSYMDAVTHWCPRSQRFTGGDALITCLDKGWEIEPEVFYEEYGQTGGRQIVVYYFELHRDNETVRMPVVNNPYVERLIHALNLKLIPAARANRASQLPVLRHA